MANQFKEFSKEELEKLRKEYSIKGSHLSEEMNRSKISIRSKANRLKIKFEPKINRVDFKKIKLLAEKGYRVKEIAKKLGIGIVIIWKICRKNNYRIRDVRKKVYLSNYSHTAKKNYFIRQIVEYKLENYYKDCCICGWNRFIEYSHIIADKNDGKFIAENIVPLCPNHHKLFDYKELEKEEKLLIVKFNNNIKNILKLKV